MIKLSEQDAFKIIKVLEKYLEYEIDDNKRIMEEAKTDPKYILCKMMMSEEDFEEDCKKAIKEVEKLTIDPINAAIALLRSGSENCEEQNNG